MDVDAMNDYYDAFDRDQEYCERMQYLIDIMDAPPADEAMAQYEEMSK